MIILSLATWLFLPLWFIFLSFDGIVYSLVAYSYKLFELMTQLNFNTLYMWFSPIISRISAIITVLIIFVIGSNLIQYLVNPDKANDNTKGGVAMLKNIAIASVLLISYNFLFSLINETTFLLVGAPEGYEYSALFDTFGVQNTEGDRGLISRFIFGGESDISSQSSCSNGKFDFGKSLAISTLQIFLHGNSDNYNPDDPSKGDTSAIGEIYCDIESGTSSFDMTKITGAATEIWRSVDYLFPLLSTAVGAYLIYTIVGIAIAVGVRAFKLITLQILAPIAIVSIIKDGTKANVFTKYLNTLKNTFLDMFMRVAAMYLTVGFLAQAWSRIGELFNNSTDAEGMTKFFLLILIVIAGFKFAKDMPKFIDEMFGSHLADNNKHGLGQFLAAAGGMALGSAAGSIIGGVAGAKNAGPGFKNRLRGAFGGAASGLGSGLGKGLQTGWNANKIQNVKDAFNSGKGIFTSAAGAGAVGLGGYIAGSMDARREKESERETKDLENLEKMKAAALAKVGNGTGKIATSYTDDMGNAIKMDLTKDKASSRADALTKDAQYRNLQRRLQNANENGGVEKISDYSEDYRKLQARLDSANANGESADDIRAQMTEMELEFNKTHSSEYLRHEILSKENEFNAIYDKEVANTLQKDKTYSDMAETYSKKYISKINRERNERKTADELKNDFINKSGEATKQRRAEISYGSTQRAIRQRPGNNGGKK